MEEESNKNQLSVVKNNYLAKVSNTLSITNKLLNEIDNREPSDDFRVAIPDVNFQKYLSKELGIDVSEGTVAYGDLKEVTEIKCENCNIYSLKGIEYFVNLIELWCSRNQILNLDVSKNKELRILVCFENQLTNLDITNNSVLTKLACGNNQLSDLDISNNMDLTLFVCSKNQLTNLDLKNNINLNELNCDKNQLIDLDVSKNTYLTWLDCSKNKLTHIDISKNNKLNKFYCSDNRLTFLDVTKNTALTWLKCSCNLKLKLPQGFNIDYIEYS